MSQEFRLKNINETRNYFLEEIEQNELMSRKHKKVCTTLNYIEHFLILASTITGCVSISAFASLIGIPIGITSSAIGLKICAITAGIKKYKSIIKKKKNKHDKIVLLAKSKLNIIEVLISKVLINSNVINDKLVLIRGCQFDPSCSFSKNVSSRERVKPWLFETFNIIKSHIFSENFIEILKLFRSYEEFLCQY